MKMKRLSYIICGLALVVMSVAGCKKKDSTPKTEEDIRTKIEQIALKHAESDESLGDFDSVKFVSYTPYYKHVYCDFMCQLLKKQMEFDISPRLDSALASRDTEALAQLDEEMQKREKAIEFYNQQSHNLLATKDDPIVGYEAKCYSYTDGYIQEIVYFVTKDWKVAPFDPYDFSVVK